MAGFLIGLLNILLVLASLFLIFLVLIQRGKGGGLAGAFGGPGGSSAFGTKAGDIFTKITIITAGVWICLAMFQVVLINRGGTASAFQGNSQSVSDLPFSDDSIGGDLGGSKDTGTSTSTGTGTESKAPTTGEDASLPSPEKSTNGLPSAIDGADSPGSAAPATPTTAEAPAEAPAEK